MGRWTRGAYPPQPWGPARQPAFSQDRAKYSTEVA
jgi:hypothetical protein